VWLTFGLREPDLSTEVITAHVEQSDARVAAGVEFSSDERRHLQRDRQLLREDQGSMRPEPPEACRPDQRDAARLVTAVDDRCELTARFKTDDSTVVVVVRCMEPNHHNGDCTMIDPRAQQPVRVAKSATKW
jgi:hypothetical protein